MADALLQPDEDGFARAVISNPLAVGCEVRCDTTLGEGSVVTVEESNSTPAEDQDGGQVRRVGVCEEDTTRRKQSWFPTLRP